jgi:hypothetical protein
LMGLWVWPDKTRVCFGLKIRFSVGLPQHVLVDGGQNHTVG